MQGIHHFWVWVFTFFDTKLTKKDTSHDEALAGVHISDFQTTVKCNISYNYKSVLDKEAGIYIILYTNFLATLW